MTNFERGKRAKDWKLAGGIFIAGLLGFGIWSHFTPTPDLSDVCAQYPAIVPPGNFNDSKQFTTDEYIKYSAELLSGTVRIPTESFDDMAKDPRDDPRFKVFGKLHHYLDKQFPRVSEYKETINEYALLYTIPGSSKGLEPILFMAHQDVVPVNHQTWNQWDHEPFSGYFDGEWLYGRGSVDTKNSLVAQLEAIENLLAQGWKPKRTVLLAYGCDEELDGSRGAKHLSSTIEQRYGRHQVKLIVDEGDGIETRGDTLFAMPAVAEKGIVDFNIQLMTPGGHSSAPPDHTGIGIIAKLATLLEANPLKGEVDENSIFTEIFGCIGRWDESLDSKTRQLYTQLDSSSARRKLVAALDKHPETRYLARTSQSIDVVFGGVKINALPELVTLQVDHRIAVHESIAFLQDRLSRFILDLCKTYDLGAEFDGQVLAEGTSKGLFNITSFGGYDPAPVSATKGKVWETIAGVTRNIFPSAVVGPNIMIGNTDTGNYWNVSKNIYRYNPCLLEDSYGLHTVNEKLRFRSHISAVRWFYEFTLQWTV